MTAHDGTLYVKLGPAATSHPLANRRGAATQGYLAALDLEAQKKRLFEIHLDSPAWGSSWALEGAPVTDGRSLYILLRRRDNVRHQAHIACFDIRRGRLRWRQFLAAADTLGQGQYIEFTHNLLTLDQGMLYCNTNLGAVAAVRAEDGQIQWVVRYPRRPASGGEPYRSLRHVYRDVTPCMAHKDLVFVAPGDCDRVFALDAGTGLLQWATDAQTAVDVVHLLGVGQGHLLASGSRLYWIDIRSGELVARFPARLEDDTRGYGRGLLAGDSVYWPTVGRIHVFRQSGPRQVRQPIDLAPFGMRGGNLVLSDDLLLIAGSERLTALTAHRDAMADAGGDK
jgi:outer membrane protein assembly factor BamB